METMRQKTLGTRMFTVASLEQTLCVKSGQEFRRVDSVSVVSNFGRQ